MDMSRFLDDPREGFQERGWVMSGIQAPTTVRGRCARFDYIMRGLNTEVLKVIRVDIDTSDMEDSEASQDNQDSQEDENEASLRSVLSRDIEATVGEGASLVKVNTISLYFSSKQTLLGSNSLGEQRPDGWLGPREAQLLLHLPTHLYIRGHSRHCRGQQLQGLRRPGQLPAGGRNVRLRL